MKKIGIVSHKEMEEIKSLYERRSGLNELAKVLSPNDKELYDKLVKDLSETSLKYQDWWNRMAAKYGWEGRDGGNWQINFDTCDIYLN